MSYIENIRTFVRVFELGSMSAAARDQRISPAVASARIQQLEEHLNIRLFQRTTRAMNPTEQGNLFYAGARRILTDNDYVHSDTFSAGFPAARRGGGRLASRRPGLRRRALHETQDPGWPGPAAAMLPPPV